MKKFLKYDYYIITFISALIVVVSAFILKKVAPFGDNSLLTIDFYHQYGPMLGELYDRLHNGLNLVYSFNMGMGLPFFRNFFNYLSSPFNILILLFRRRELLMSYSLIIGLKAVVSAVTMGIFLKNKFGKNYAWIALSLLYAFNAYYVAYYWNIMWIDGLVWLPIIALGIERLIDNNKILLYIISLAIMLFTNYFIGYMLCIFSVLYFISYLIIKTDKIDFKKIFKKILYFGLSSLIAGGLCACFLIPLYFALKGISATSDIWPTSQYYDFTLKEFLFNHFSGIGSTVLKSGVTCAPNISIGALSIPLIIIFLISPKINLKTKCVYSLLLIFLLASFLIAPLDYIWHAFHVPNDLPYRYSFIYSFILTIMCAYGIKNIDDINPLWIHIIYIISLILITLMKILNFENINTNMLILNYIFLSIFYLCYIIKVYFKKWKIIAIIFMIITSIIHGIVFINNNWEIDHNIDGFYSDYKETIDALNNIKANDKDMYRLEKLNMLSFNDPSWYGYYGQVTFSSMEYENMATLNHYLGMPGNEINSYYYKENTPIYNLMFNIKYLLGYASDMNNFSIYHESENFNIYKNNYNIGLMYGVNGNIITWNNNSSNPFENQNEFIYRATDIPNVLEKIDKFDRNIVYEDDNKTIIKYHVKNIKDNIYLYFDSYDIDFVIINNTLYYKGDDHDYYENIDNINIYDYVDYNENFIINQISDTDYIDVYIGYNYYVVDELEMYKLNKENFEMAYSYLNNNKVNISDFKENFIKGSINTANKMLIYTSIPYDDGWDVYVDGKIVNTEVIANSLLGFEIDEGEHTIELKYHIPYFKLGLLISLSSLVGLGLFIKLKKD